jgi:hypothetical protein
MKDGWMLSIARFAAATLAGAALMGCGEPDAPLVWTDGGSTVTLPTPTLGPAGAPPCTDPHTVCMTVQMPATIPGPPTHLAVGYYLNVPVMAPAQARGVIRSPPLVAGQVFHLEAWDGGLSGPLYPVVLVYMPGGGGIIAVDGLDYTAQAMETYEFAGAPINVSEVMQLVYGI